jgi:Ca-activated chloride channel family protein
MKGSRIALLAAAQLCCGALACETALAGSLSDAWSDLWRTPDQQGQALLEAGEPGAAAARFQDPRRRAYADLEAGRYPQAAKLLAPFTDPQSEYNRGNALAETGQLREALAAYDAALKQAPADEDIRHNRDLVERALRQQQQSARSQGRQGDRKSGSSGHQPQQSAGERSGSGSQHPGGSSQPSGGSSPQSGGARSQSAGRDQTASNGSQSGASQSGNAAAQQSGQPGNPQASGTPQSAGASGPNSATEASAQAKRDAALAAALAHAQQQHGAGNPGQTPDSQRRGAPEPGPKSAANAPDAGNLLAGGAQTPKQKPETEKQLALDQWLRQIPDSPAGLLQRKFLIEHMMRQQNGDDSQGAGQ